MCQVGQLRVCHLCCAEQQAAQQSQALKMFSQLLNQTSQAAATEIPTPPAGASQNGLEVSQHAQATMT